MKFDRISWILPAIVYLFCVFTVNAAPSTSLISGVVATSNGVGIEGVDVVGDNGAGSSVTTADGAYSIVVPNNWNGTISVSKTGWLITPATKTYSNVRVDTPNENYIAYQPIISGYAQKADGTGLSGAVVSGSGAGSVTTTASGSYELTVRDGWTGARTASLRGYSFGSRS